MSRFETAVFLSNSALLPALPDRERRERRPCDLPATSIYQGTACDSKYSTGTVLRSAFGFDLFAHHTVSHSGNDIDTVT